MKYKKNIIKIIYLLIFLFLFLSSSFLLAGDPLDTYDGTEDWYKDRVSDNGLIVYYDPSYEKDMKEYLSYLKRKQKKSIFKKKSILSKLNSNISEKDNNEEIGDLGKIDLEDELNEKDGISNETVVDDNNKSDLFLIDENVNTDKIKIETRKETESLDSNLDETTSKLEKKKARLKKEAEELRKKEEELEKKKKKIYQDSNKYDENGFVDDEDLEDLD